MSLVDTLQTNKTHIIYGIGLILLGSVAYHFFKKDPVKVVTVETKVVTQEKIVNKIVYVDRKIAVDKTITTHKANGDTVIEVNKSHIDIVSKSDTKSTEKIAETNTKSTEVTFMKNYTIDVLFPINPLQPTAVPNPLDTQLLIGMRIFSFPVFVVSGTDFHFNKVLIGARLEF
jgi:hypothetical protein